MPQETPSSGHNLTNAAGILWKHLKPFGDSRGVDSILSNLQLGGNCPAYALPYFV